MCYIDTNNSSSPLTPDIRVLAMSSEKIYNATGLNANFIALYNIDSTTHAAQWATLTGFTNTSGGSITNAASDSLTFESLSGLTNNTIYTKWSIS